MRRRADGVQALPEVSELLLSVFAGGESAAGALRDLQAGRLAGDSFVGRHREHCRIRELRRRDHWPPGLGARRAGHVLGCSVRAHPRRSRSGQLIRPERGALLGALISAGVDEGFLARSREALVPGTSAVALLLSDEDRDEDPGPLRERGGTLIVTSLRPGRKRSSNAIRWDRMSNALLHATKRSKPTARHEHTPTTEE